MKNTSPEVLREMFHEEDDIKEFLADMEQLIKDETMHAEICEKQSRGFSKVMYGT
ncbi:MAG: hypothetical protein R2741_12235 [Methanolobus sp.]